MKNIILYLLLIVLTSCSYNSFEAPPVESSEGFKQPNVTISQLKELIDRGIITKNYIVTGVVTGSDSSGNCYKQLYVEDKSGALEVRINAYDTYLEYKRWDSVTLDLKGLSVGVYEHTLQVGYSKSNSLSIDQIGTMYLLKSHLQRHFSFNELLPSVISISDITTLHAGRYIALQGNFSTEDSFVGNREFADHTGSLNVVTSEYAAFANTPLPQGEVIIRGIVTYSGNTPRLKIVSTSDITLLP